jgi:predicted dehydrogenase
MKKVRLGIIGLGNIGMLHYGYMHEIEGAELTAICDIDESKLERPSMNKSFDHARVDIKDFGSNISKYTDYKELLDSGKVDAVIVAAPHYFHPEMAIAAFDRGSHVLCEKPAAITAKEARRINEAHKDSGLIYSLMFNMRTSPVFRKIKELLDNGTLGEVRRVSWVVTSWFRTQKYYDSGGWRGNWTGEGGGVLMNQCPHNLDLFQWYFGLPCKLYALVDLGKWHDITVEDNVSVVMRLKNGAHVSFMTTTGETPGTNYLEIAGDRGKLICENNRKITFIKTKNTVQSIIDKSDEEFYSDKGEIINIPIEKGEAQHKTVTQNFVNAIRGEEELLVKGDDGLMSIELANAILFSGLEDKVVTPPLLESEYERLLERLKQHERVCFPNKVFDWDVFLKKFRASNNLDI